MKWNWLHRILLLISVLVLLNACAFFEQVNRNIEQTHQERMESYDVPEQLNGNPQNTGILLVDAIMENAFNNLYLSGVAIANTTNTREPGKPILLGSFKKGGFLSQLSHVVVVPNLQPGIYKIVKVQTDNQKAWETTYMPITKEFEVAIYAGDPTYFGQINIRAPFGSADRIISIKYDKKREADSWKMVMEKYSDSPWVTVINTHIKELR
jgi:hypothetical protein